MPAFYLSWLAFVFRDVDVVEVGLGAGPVINVWSFDWGQGGEALTVTRRFSVLYVWFVWKSAFVGAVFGGERSVEVHEGHPVFSHHFAEGIVAGFFSRPVTTPSFFVRL